MTEIRMPDGTHLAYTVYHETHWWQHLTPQTRPNDGRPCVQVHASAKGQGGGSKWEFAIVEYDLGKRALHLEMFDEAWQAFVGMPAFFAALATREVETLDDVRELLNRLGAVDETEREVVVDD